MDIQILLMLHDRFTNIVQVLLCEFNRENLENMKKEPNNPHIPQYLSKR